MAKTTQVDWDEAFKRIPKPTPVRPANWPAPVPPTCAAPTPPDGYGFGVTD